ncbi:chemotaxis protein CheC [Halegenticoccus tardaugens]|uniref:chemotaxis protein CheC n=1 Tax=Halegenticoccus tardaugens TaxID=2071624 RepID=UPI00100B8920|nr:chemotaxis protein CheC [Halegenticoccus tardaugens]
MNVDIRSLGLFSRLAREGSRQAARSLSRLTGTDVFVEVTDVALAAREDLEDAFGDREFVGVRVGFEGRFEGDAVLLFERECVAALLDLLLPDAEREGMDDLARSGVEEVGNIVTSGFVDGWADYLETAIDVEPPTYVESDGRELLPLEPLDAGGREEAFLFENQLETADGDVSFSVYLLPAYGAFASLMADHGNDDEAIPVDKLSVFNRMTKRGAERAAENLSTMTGVETAVDVSRVTFVPIEEAPRRVGDEPTVGVVIGFDGLPSGYLLFLLDEDSASRVVDALVPGASADDGLGEMGESAIKEVGNVMTSGFIDGWANVLGTTIDHTPPEFVHDMGSTVMSPVVGQLGRTQDFVFVVDSTIRAAGREFACDIYALPNERELRRALSVLSADRLDRTPADADQLF